MLEIIVIATNPIHTRLDIAAPFGGARWGVLTVDTPFTPDMIDRLQAERVGFQPDGVTLDYSARRDGLVVSFRVNDMSPESVNLSVFTNSCRNGHISAGRGLSGVLHVPAGLAPDLVKRLQPVAITAFKGLDIAPILGAIDV